MPQLIILSLQILYFCLAWLLVTFNITPFTDAWNFISKQSAEGSLPDWAIHTHYLFALIFITAGITFTLRLKVMKQINSTALIFLSVLLIAMAFSPELYLMNLLKYSYIVLIPIIFQKIILQDGANIQSWIKSCVQMVLIFSTYQIALYLIQLPILNETASIISVSIVAIIAIAASITLYTKKYYNQALNLALVLFIAGNIIQFLELIYKAPSFDFNMLPLGFISWSMILFTFWVRKMLSTQA